MTRHNWNYISGVSLASDASYDCSVDSSKWKREIRDILSWKLCWDRCILSTVWLCYVVVFLGICVSHMWHNWNHLVLELVVLRFWYSIFSSKNQLYGIDVHRKVIGCISSEKIHRLNPMERYSYINTSVDECYSSMGRNLGSLYANDAGTNLLQKCTSLGHSNSEFSWI